MKERDARIVVLEDNIVKLNNELADKDYELEFYMNQEEAKETTPQVMQQAVSAAPINTQELEKLKKKCRMLQIREAELQDEIEAMRGLNGAKP